MCNYKQFIIFLVFVILTYTNLCVCVENVNSYPRNSLTASVTKKLSFSPVSPRLGRRLKRNPKENAMYLNGNRDEINDLAEFIQENPWAIYSNIPESQKRQMNFTPRLGRESGEEGPGPVAVAASNMDRWFQDSEMMSGSNSGDLMTQRSPPFAPRLGRRLPNNGNNDNGLLLTLPFGR